MPAVGRGEAGARRVARGQGPDRSVFPRHGVPAHAGEEEGHGAFEHHQVIR